MRLLERERRADSSTGPAWLPTRITQASNFSVVSRSALSEVIETLSMPNWRKHSESRLREDSCRSTSAARAENFLEGAKGTREFPNEFSVRVASPRAAGLRQTQTGSPEASTYRLGATPKTPFWRGNPATATTN